MWHRQGWNQWNFIVVRLNLAVSCRNSSARVVVCWWQVAPWLKRKRQEDKREKRQSPHRAKRMLKSIYNLHLNRLSSSEFVFGINVFAPNCVAKDNQSLRRCQIVHGRCLRRFEIIMDILLSLHEQCQGKGKGPSGYGEDAKTDAKDRLVTGLRWFKTNATEKTGGFTFVHDIQQLLNNETI